MKKPEIKLTSPIEQMDSAVDECARNLAFALYFLKVNNLDASRTMRCEEVIYEIDIKVKKIERSVSAEGN